MCCNLFLEVCGPGELHQQPHKQGRGDREGPMIEKANRHKAKDEWVGCAPEPEILVQDVEHDNCEYQQDLFHDLSAKPYWQKPFAREPQVYGVNSPALENCYGKNCYLRVCVEAQIAA